MIDKIVQLFNIFIIVCFLFAYSMLASYADEAEKAMSVISHTLYTCKTLRLSCNAGVIESNYVNAYTTCNNSIYFTTAIIDRLTLNELKAIAYHEIGHVALKHCNTTKKYVEGNWNGDLGLLQMFKYNQEFEADMFATKLSKANKEFNYLPSALLRITKGNETKRGKNHPDTITRIQRINSDR